MINSLLASLLQYPTAAIFTPPKVISEYKKIIVNFLWNGKTQKIAYKTLTFPIDRGGLKLMDLGTRIQVNLLQWTKRIIGNPDSNAARTLKSLIGTRSLRDYFSHKRGLPPEWTKNHRFYRSVMTTWGQFHGFEPTTETEVRAEILWRNKRILNAGSPLRRGE